MPISVLLIDGDCAHAQAVVGALVDPWLDWAVEVAPSLAHARPVLARQQTDVVLTVRRVVDGTAFDVLELLDNVPALLIVPAAAARNLARSAGRMFWWALVISLSSAVTGLLVSAQDWASTATGATVVLASCAWFVLSMAISALRGRADA